MLRTFTPSSIQGIIKPENLTPSGNLTALKADSQDEPTIKEPCFMLPENRPIGYRISTTATEENEFECDRCNTTECRPTIRQGKIASQCVECGWMPEDLTDLTTNKDVQLQITIPAVCYTSDFKASAIQIKKRNDKIVLSLHGLTPWVKDYEIYYLTDNLNTKTFKLRYKDPKLVASGFLIDVEIADYNYAVQCLNNAPKAIAAVGGVG
jgi:hypothetical protein